MPKRAAWQRTGWLRWAAEAETALGVLADESVGGMVLVELQRV